MSSLSTLFPGSRLQMRSLQHRLLVSRPLESPNASVSWDDSCRRDLRWWSDPSHLVVGVDLSLPHPELMLFTDTSDAGWGTSLGSDHLSGLWSREVCLYSINHRELLAVFLAYPGVSPSPPEQVNLSAHRQHVSSVLPPQGRGHALLHAQLRGPGHPSPLRGLRCSSAPPICSRSTERLSQLPQLEWAGPLFGVNSPQGCVSGTFPPLAGHGGFVRHLLNHRLQVYFSPMADPQAAAVDALIHSWDHLQAYAFPPFSLIQKVLSMVRGSHNLELTLVAPYWPLRPWFPDLLDLLVEVLVLLPQRQDLLRQPHYHQFHRNLRALGLNGFRIASNPRANSASLREWLANLPSPGTLPRN